MVQHSRLCGVWTIALDSTKTQLQQVAHFQNAYILKTLSQGSRLQLCHQPSSPSRDKVTSVTDPAKDLKAKTVAHPHTQLVLINVLPNANKDPRPILDRRRLNMHLKVCPLQIRCTVTPGEWFTFIDLKDSYFDSQAFQGRAYQSSMSPVPGSLHFLQNIW